MTDHSPQPAGRRGVIRLQRPRCVRCKLTRFKVYGGKDQTDGSRLQYATCLGCGLKHKVFWE